MLKMGPASSKEMDYQAIQKARQEMMRPEL